MSLSDQEVAVIFKADACDYMIAAENLRTDESSIWPVAPTYGLTPSSCCSRPASWQMVGL